MVSVIEKSSTSRGDVLLTSTPFAYIVKGSLRSKYCEMCFTKKPSLQRCSGCASLYYCNRECQKESWATHKVECIAWRKLKPKFPPDTARLMARIIWKLQAGGHDIEEKVDEGHSRKFSSLVNHYTDVMNDPERQEHFTSLVVVLGNIFGKEQLPSVEELGQIYGKVLVNSFTITDKYMNSIGIGVYLAGSILDHSCQPNAYAAFNGPNLVVRSLINTSQKDLGQFSISYIDSLNTRENRRKELQRGYFFHCRCILCLSEKRERMAYIIQCTNEKCESPVYVDCSGESEDSIRCLACDHSDFESETRHRLAEITSSADEKFRLDRDVSLGTCTELLQGMESLLHPLNMWYVKTLDTAFEAAIKRGKWAEAMAYGKQNLDGLRHYYGSSHPIYGLSLLKLAKVELHLFKFASALGHVEAAEPILKKTHGLDHALVREDLGPLLRQARQEAAMVNMNGFKLS